jgi:hypothetical protein
LICHGCSRRATCAPAFCTAFACGRDSDDCSMATHPAAAGCGAAAPAPSGWVDHQKLCVAHRQLPVAARLRPRRLAGTSMQRGRSRRATCAPAFCTALACGRDFVDGSPGCRRVRRGCARAVWLVLRCSEGAAGERRALLLFARRLRSVGTLLTLRIDVAMKLRLARAQLTADARSCFSHCASALLGLC